MSRRGDILGHMGWNRRGVVHPAGHGPWPHSLASLIESQTSLNCTVLEGRKPGSY